MNWFTWAIIFGFVAAFFNTICFYYYQGFWGGVGGWVVATILFFGLIFETMGDS